MMKHSFHQTHFLSAIWQHVQLTSYQFRQPLRLKHTIELGFQLVYVYSYRYDYNYVTVKRMKKIEWQLFLGHFSQYFSASVKSFCVKFYTLVIVRYSRPHISINFWYSYLNVSSNGINSTARAHRFTLSSFEYCLEN